MMQADDHAIGASGGPSEDPGRRGRGSRFGLRSRMLGAILVVALTTVGVGAFGINRMAALSDHAEQVYAEGAVPLDGLRRLESDWWQLSANVARSNIAVLPPATIATAKERTAEMMQVLADRTQAVGTLPLAPEARAAFTDFAAATFSTVVRACWTLASVASSRPRVKLA